MLMVYIVDNTYCPTEINFEKIYSWPNLENYLVESIFGFRIYYFRKNKRNRKGSILLSVCLLRINGL